MLQHRGIEGVIAPPASAMAWGQMAIRYLVSVAIPQCDVLLMSVSRDML